MNELKNLQQLSKIKVLRNTIRKVQQEIIGLYAGNTTKIVSRDEDVRKSLTESIKEIEGLLISISNFRKDLRVGSSSIRGNKSILHATEQGRVGQLRGEINLLESQLRQLMGELHLLRGKLPNNITNVTKIAAEGMDNNNEKGEIRQTQRETIESISVKEPIIKSPVTNVGIEVQMNMVIGVLCCFVALMDKKKGILHSK